LPVACNRKMRSFDTAILCGNDRANRLIV